MRESLGIVYNVYGDRLRSMREEIFGDVQEPQMRVSVTLESNA